MSTCQLLSEASELVKQDSIWHNLLQNALPLEVHTQVLVKGEKALVQVVQLVVVLHQQLQTGLVTTRCAHGLKQQHTSIYL